MLTSKQIKEIRKALEEATNPLFFFDDDQDGIAAYLLLKRKYKKGKGIRHTLDTIGALLAAGIEVDLAWFPQVESVTQPKKAMQKVFPAHLKPIALPKRPKPKPKAAPKPTLSKKRESIAMSSVPKAPVPSAQQVHTTPQAMAAAPWLPPAMQDLSDKTISLGTPVPPTAPKQEIQPPAAQPTPASAASSQSFQQEVLPPTSAAPAFSAPVQHQSTYASSLSVAPQQTSGLAPSSHFGLSAYYGTAGAQEVYDAWSGYHAQLSQVHQNFITQQNQLHLDFLAMQQRSLQQLTQNAYAFTQGATYSATPALQSHTVHAPQPVQAPQSVQSPQQTQVKRTQVPTTPVGSNGNSTYTRRNGSIEQAPTTPLTAPKVQVKQAPAPKPAPLTQTKARSAPKQVVKAKAVTPKKAEKAVAQSAKAEKKAKAITKQPVGLKLNREQLNIHASGNISEIFGPLFKQQDGYERQVRMPEPPLLLADRVTGIDAEAGSMQKGTIWTETDVNEDSWYLHNGYMPAGIMIESGQADLMLISYLGIDFINKSERVYRLLGCELTYHGNLPTPGDTLCYDIHVDGHAKSGEARLFFFHYDCRVDGELRLSVRQGQAGFFTDEELANSAGILWSAEEAEPVANPRLDGPEIVCKKQSFSRQDIEAYADGRPWDCFGMAFDFTKTHTRTPRIQDDRMLFLEEITVLDLQGGPWKRGYLKAESTIHSDDWFFDGHFKNDPCMPGTLMFEGCLQSMAFYMASMGFTVQRDGWRFQPVSGIPIQMRCRGQVRPNAKKLTYEVFIEEVHDGPIPTIYADLLCTVDGLKAFHAKRVGLSLVPDWPLTSLPKTITNTTNPLPSAKAGDFTFDYESLLSCAWGKPSNAFGSMFERYDGVRRVARLPGPPYHFMSNITRTEGELGVLKPGAFVEAMYDIPEDEWYFDENGNRTMPFCVLLEAALQPCGWLASYVGSALVTDQDLSFRNLDGTGTLHDELFIDAGSLRTTSRLTNVSKSAGMVIESFDVECFLGDRKVYTMNTVFGYFPKAALENQKGLATSKEKKALLTEPSNYLVDLTQRPEKYCGGKIVLPEPMLLMLDRVTGYWPEGGEKGLGRLRAEKTVDKGEWFFKAHFFQDPVQPGSLGIEAMLQLLQFYMLETDMAKGIENPRFEPIATDKPLTWKYRGQVVPKNKLIQTTMDIIEVGEDEKGPYALANTSLWVDGMRIYEAVGMGMRIVGTTPPKPRQKAPSTPGAEVLDPKSDTWLADHCPTWCHPALPMMSMVERLASAIEGQVKGLKNIKIKQWLDLPEARTLRTQVEGDQVTLLASSADGEVEIATGVVETGKYDNAPSALAPIQGEKVEAPYDSGHLFHGPAFHFLTSLTMGKNGSSSILNADLQEVPVGKLHQGLLDAATHGIPHDRLHLWSDKISEDQVAYPAMITALNIYSATPTSGSVRCEVRFDGFFGGSNFPAFKIQLIHNNKVWIACRLVESCFPKGRIGSAEASKRRDFLKDRVYVEGLSLSKQEADQTILTTDEVEASDWFPGTIESIYGTKDTQAIAVQEHAAKESELHPGTVLSSLPLTDFHHEVTTAGQEVTVSSAQKPTLSLSSTEKIWAKNFKRKDWVVEDLYLGLMERFIRRVVLTDPEAFEKAKGRNVLYLGNHQVGIESLLFSFLSTALVGTPTITLAKIEHQTTWLGKLIAHCSSHPLSVDPKLITFFDRKNKASLPGILKELAVEMVQSSKSVLVHVEGTRSLACGTGVQKMSGIFIDMAIQLRAPIIPVRFFGALPTETMEKRIEFPIHMGQQDLYLGRPLMPEELENIPYKDRKRFVIDAMNDLGQPIPEERPIPGDADFDAKVSAYQAQSGATHEHSTLMEILKALPNPSADSQALLKALETGEFHLTNSPEDKWMAHLAQNLFGPNGPKIIVNG